jgi:hypothetical protein
LQRLVSANIENLGFVIAAGAQQSDVNVLEDLGSPVAAADRDTLVAVGAPCVGPLLIGVTGPKEPSWNPVHKRLDHVLTDERLILLSVAIAVHVRAC